MLLKRIQGETGLRNGCYYEFDQHSQPVGQGGMGAVYKGYCVNTATGMRHVVAIKEMYTDLPPEVYERAECEASIQIRHDNLVEMYGFVTEMETDQFGIQKPRYYVISEFLDGIVLSDLLNGQIKGLDGTENQYAKRLYSSYISDKEKTSVEIIRSILSGIMALHDKGYIHRDIDPTNIMVTVNGHIKLIDFGIAKYVRSLGSVDRSVTATGRFIGKAEYASPELVLGDVPNQGYVTDIYAIGILFYQLLVGKLPFVGSTYEVLQRQLKEKIPVKNIRNSAYAKIVKKATEKIRTDRYSTIAEFRVALDEAVNNGGKSGGGKWISVAAIAASVVLCITVATVVLLNINGKQGDDLAIDDTTDIVPVKPEIQIVDLEGEYNIALNKLNSSDKKLVKQGFSEMKKLADSSGYALANCEVGITYFTNEKKLPIQTLTRRKCLDLNSNVDKDLSIQYLVKANDSDCKRIDALYLLGYSYWSQGRFDEAATVLDKASDLLSKTSQDNINGFSRSKLNDEINKYLTLSRKELRR